MTQVFKKEWFKKNQPKLLWLVNHSSYFREDLGIQECDLPHGEKITDITPNSFSYGDRPFLKDGKLFIERTTDFRTHEKFGKRLYYGFYPIWNLAHKFDMTVANRFVPAMNLGFDTLTVYPDADPETTTVDGYVIYDVALVETWATVRNAADGNGFSDASTAASLARADFIAGAVRYVIARQFFLFDTSSLPDVSTISTAVLSLCADGNAPLDGNSSAIHILSSTPASNTALANADYDQVGTTSFSSINLASWNSTNLTYNNFSLNASGIANISKTGVSKFGVKNSLDLNNSAPTDLNRTSCYFADQAGTSSDPKLVVTYSLPVTAFAQSNLTLLGIG